MILFILSILSCFLYREMNLQPARSSFRHGKRVICACLFNDRLLTSARAAHKAVAQSFRRVVVAVGRIFAITFVVLQKGKLTN